MDWNTFGVFLPSAVGIGTPSAFCLRLLGLERLRHFAFGCWGWNAFGILPSAVGVGTPSAFCLRLLGLERLRHFAFGCWGIKGYVFCRLTPPPAAPPLGGEGVLFGCFYVWGEGFEIVFYFL